MEEPFPQTIEEVGTLAEKQDGQPVPFQRPTLWALRIRPREKAERQELT